MNTELLYYLWASLLLVLNLVAWCSTFVTLPGNWIIAGATAIFAYSYTGQADGHGVSWMVVAIVAGLAVLGELIELFAGAAGAAKQGASRRSIVLALLGTVSGSLLGAIVGSLILPLLGAMIGAIAGGGGGAFLGAYLGEWWVGKTNQVRLSVSTAALIGRVAGTVGKLAVGAVMVVIVTYDSFF